MPSSPNSLTITAMRRPPALSRMWRSSVVLPLPRKPVTMVTGILADMANTPVNQSSTGIRAMKWPLIPAGQLRNGTWPVSERRYWRA
ncbi:hypothetical protein D9M70_302590 [compost metagenome]